MQMLNFGSSFGAGGWFSQRFLIATGTRSSLTMTTDTFKEKKIDGPQ